MLNVAPARAPDPVSLDQNVADELVERARDAQNAIDALDDARLDKVVRAIVGAFSKDVEGWAERELAVTRIGNRKDKTHKLGLVLTRVFHSLHGVRTRGRIGYDQSLIEYASPVGVIFAVVPLTNPVPNSLFKALLCIKTRNALIASFPQKADSVGAQAFDLIRGVLAEEGLPADLVQRCAEPSHSRTKLLMSHSGVALVLATGGSQLVGAAYSSGTPTIGVGPGNVPVLVASSADVGRAARDIVKGKAYDNGIVCGSESNIVVDERVRAPFLEALTAAGAVVVEGDARSPVIEALFDPETRRLRRELLGVDGDALAAAAGLEVTHRVACLVLAAERGEYPFIAQEKMAPLLTLFTAEQGRGVDDAAALLWSEGAGHTAVIHSSDPVEIDAFATAMPAGRILVNTSATHGMLGETSDLPVSFMQGSGSWGGNGTTDPITWRHLVNIKRLAFGRG
ncbi:MAG TPA: aldehyde dehydrogenase family protein [Methylosinus sp.]|jgi:acetaldehyde dehydrogenase/alcohol dehydrogenase|uniref:aldehyde dehydrogenase family protein n=1 Tax=Methylosinus sp. TaxID=427 RepID=UPI002F923FC6